MCLRARLSTAPMLADIGVNEAGADLLGNSGILLRGKGEADLVAGDGHFYRIFAFFDVLKTLPP